MLSNRLAFAVLVAACMAAAGAGSYIATRQNTIPAVAEGAGITTLPAERAAADNPVREPEPGAKPTSRAADPPAAAARSAAVTPSKRDQPPAKAAAPPQTTPRAPRTNASASTPESAPSSAATASANAAQAPAVPALPVVPPPAEAAPPAPKPEERLVQEAPRPPDPPQKTFEELVVRADSVIGLQAETGVSSERARVEDRVEARVSRDVRVRDAVAIPAGTHAIGSVVSVERGGKFKERARLGIRFNTLVLTDGTRLPISTETIYRDGDSPGRESAAKVGGATAAGAILGAIFGGGKGAAIGATAGAGAGSATVAASDRNPATLRAGEPITVRILSPIAVTIEQK